MTKNKIIAFLLLLVVGMPFAASADRFFVEPTDLEVGKTGTLQFVLENTQDYYGFQAEVKLPKGLQAVKGTDGELSITLSNRAKAGEYKVNSNVLSDGSLIMGAFSANHTAFTGTDGVLVNLNVSVAEDFKGGDVEVSKIMMIDNQDKDVELASTSAFIGVKVTGISLSDTELSIKEGATATLTATITPAAASDKTVVWTSSDETVATVSAEGKVTAVKVGSATITATASSGISATCSVTVLPILAESVTLDRSEWSGTEGDTFKLTATVKPDNTTDKAVTWTSSNEAVATVDADGNVSTLSEGTATITATCGEASATCVLTVAKKIIEVTGITLSNTELKLTEGNTAALTATIAPENATDKTVTWTSSDEAVATVDAKGNVTAVKAGSATITATSANGKTATCAVTVAAKVIEVTGITLNATELKLTEGDTAALTATITPENATDKSVTWTSSNEAVAKVDAKGTVTAVKAGTATITATSANGKTATCEVTVSEKAPEVVEVTGITLSAHDLSLTEGDTAALIATIAPENATDKTVTWTSSDEAVATVDANGTVTAVKVGTAIITATSANGLSASCEVTVTEKAPEVIYVETLTIDPTVWSGEEGSEFTITATVMPEDATDKTLVWSSSDESVATVDSEGHVKVLKEGTCVITVSTIDGSDLTAECEITSLAGVEAIFAEDAAVDVYDMNGALLKRGCMREELGQLKAGIYILRSSARTVKAVVR